MSSESMDLKVKNSDPLPAMSETSLDGGRECSEVARVWSGERMERNMCGVWWARWVGSDVAGMPSHAQARHIRPIFGLDMRGAGQPGPFEAFVWIKILQPGSDRAARPGIRGGFGTPGCRCSYWWPIRFLEAEVLKKHKFLKKYWWPILLCISRTGAALTSVCISRHLFLLFLPVRSRINLELKDSGGA